MSTKIMGLITWGMIFFWVVATLHQYSLGRFLLWLAIGAAMAVLSILVLRVANERLLRKFHDVPRCAGPIDAVLRLGHLEPLPPIVDEKKPWLRLLTDGDFVAEIREIKEVVVGQDQIIDSLMRDLMTRIGARKGTMPTRATPPLCAYLFVGEPGIGKRFLAGRINDHLFHEGAFLVYDFTRVDIDFVFGPDPRGLPMQLAKKPYGTVVLENVEAIAAQKLPTLLEVLRPASGHGSPLALPAIYQSCVFILTSSLAVSDLRHAAAGPTGRDEWITRATEILRSADPPLTEDLLVSCKEILLFRQPAEDDIFRVVGLSLQERLKAEGITLNWVEPHLFASLAHQYRPSRGYSLLPERISSLVDPYIKYCKEHDLSEVEIRPDFIDHGWSNPVRCP